MSPTVFRFKNYRFYFFSREEKRVHVHVSSGDGEAKFWLEPVIALACSEGFKRIELGRLQKLVERHQDEIKKSWRKHFQS